MLRLAICLMHDNGLKVCAPIHDAVLIEGDLDHQTELLSMAQKCMQRASEIILGRHSIRSQKP